MLTRTISGLVFIAVVIAAIAGGFVSSLLLFSVIAFLGTLEFYRLAAKFSHPYRYYGASFSSSLVFTIGMILIDSGFLWMIAVWVLFMVRFAILLLKSRSKRAIVDISITIAGALYLALPLVSLLALGVLDTKDFHHFTWQLPLSVFILTWINDTGAYLTGRTFGKHKLFERISPKKTWEGSIGGLVFTIIGAMVLLYYWPSYSRNIWVGAAVLVSLFANIGDLMESAFKRNAGVKDSGTIMPGHGGILDRFDAVLLAAPVVFGYFLTVNKF